VAWPTTVAVMTTRIIPISACHYSELRSAMTSDSGVPIQFILTEKVQSIGCLDIVEHKQLCLLKCYILDKWL
jgi:hypothetical protein